MLFYRPEPLQDLSGRITSEYRELPGLQLTLAQASRLFDTDPRTVEAALERLVASSFLSHAGAFYVRADVGRHWH
ncbi:MAG TPA: hypothetical protein VIX63_10005 [Vicinamibacterales bacterium]